MAESPRRGSAGSAGGSKPERGRSSSPRQAAGKPSGRSSGSSSDRRGGEATRGGGRRFERDARPEREPRSADQEVYDGPEIPEHITGKELDRSVIAQLQSLPEKLGLRVARHLVAAGLIMDEDPMTAYQHTLAARARAGRLAVVREAVGEAAYAAGEYAEALAELRAARRMNGAKDYIAMMADCERALGKPQRALDLVRAVTRDGLDPTIQAELIIVEAGARRDRGEIDAALRTLEQAPLMSKSREPWVVRLRYAYADTLLSAGRSEEALAWFHRTEAIDGDEMTDAGDRVAALEKAKPKD